MSAEGHVRETILPSVATGNIDSSVHVPTRASLYSVHSRGYGALNSINDN